MMDTLLKAGAYVDAVDNDGNTALIKAVREGIFWRMIISNSIIFQLISNMNHLDFMDSVEFLIKAGANVNHANVFNETALLLVIRAGKLLNLFSVA